MLLEYDRPKSLCVIARPAGLVVASRAFVQIVSGSRQLRAERKKGGRGIGEEEEEGEGGGRRRKEEEGGGGEVVVLK